MSSTHSTSADATQTSANTIGIRNNISTTTSSQSPETIHSSPQHTALMLPIHNSAQLEVILPLISSEVPEHIQSDPVVSMMQTQLQAGTISRKYY